MGLNLISDQGAEQLAHYYQNILKDANVQNIDRYEACFTLGLLAWRAADDKQLQTFLASAAREAVALVSARDSHDRKAERSPHSVALPFLMVLNFGNTETISALAELPRQQWFQPETDEYKPLADLLDILRNYFAGRPLIPEQLHALAALNQQPGTDLFYKPWIEALSLGLIAIACKDKKSAEQCLNQLLSLHEEMALEGAWKNLVEGLLSFWAMTLHKIAKSEGMTLQSESPYFPQ